jgi:hypothetical protein
MNKWIAVVSLAGVAFALSLVVTNSAEAQGRVWVRLDNSPNGGSVSGGTTTVNRITVDVQFCGSSNFIRKGERVLSSVSGQHDFVWSASPNQQGGHSVRRIQIAISAEDGNDWFWLDQIELFHDGERVWSAGIDNTQGWCFSDQRLRPNNTACEPDESNYFKIFEVPSPGCPNQ